MEAGLQLEAELEAELQVVLLEAVHGLVFLFNFHFPVPCLTGSFKHPEKKESLPYMRKDQPVYSQTRIMISTLCHERAFHNKG